MAVSGGSDAHGEGTERRAGLLDRLGRHFMGHPWHFLLLVILALVFLPVAVWFDLRNLSNSALERQASDLNSMITDIRAYYSS